MCSEVCGKMARGSLWSDEEVKELIAIWGEEGIQSQLDGTTRTAVQCREKLKKLKSEYRRAKDHNNRSGRG